MAAKYPTGKEAPPITLSYLVLKASALAAEERALADDALKHSISLLCVDMKSLEDEKDKVLIYIDFIRTINNYLYDVIHVDRDSRFLLENFFSDIFITAAGQVAPAFKHKRTKAPSRRHPAYEKNLVIASTIIDYLVSDKTPEEKAARRVVRFYEKNSLAMVKARPASDRQTWESLLDWRAKLRRGKQGPRAARFYDATRAIFNESDHRSSAVALMRMISQDGAPMVGGRSKRAKPAP